MPTPPVTPNPRRRGNPRMFYLLVSAAWLLLAELILITILRGGFSKPYGLIGGWASFGVSLAILVAFGWREVVNRQLESMQLRRHEETLAALAVLTEPLLRADPVDELLQEMVARARTVLRVDAAAVFLTDPLSEETTVGAVDGVAAGSIWVAPLIEDGFVNRIVASGKPDTWSMSPEQVPHPSSGRWCTSAAGCPLVVGNRVTGVCVIGAADRREFDDADIRLLQVVAGHVAVRIERARLDEAERTSRLAAEQARRHVSLVARAGGALATAIDDYQSSLSALLDVVVPEYADWCIVDLAEQGAISQRQAFRHRDERIGPADAAVAAYFPDWMRLREQALQSGRPQLAWTGGERAPLAVAGDRTHRPEPDQGSSCMVAPIRAGGLAMGTMTFATDPGRRGFRPSDLALAEEVVDRVSLAVERVLLYREVSEAARASAQTATQLRQLVEGSLSLQRLRSGTEIVSVVASAARTVLGADLAVVTGRISPEQCLRAVARRDASTTCHPVDDSLVEEAVPEDLDGRPAGRDAWLSVPLSTPEGRGRGTIAVAREEATGPDGHAVVVLLAQLASAALDALDHYRSAVVREDRWRALIEATPAAIVEIAPNDGVVLWNRSAAVMFGWADHDESVEVPPSFVPATAVAFAELWTGTLTGKETVEAELTVEAAHGTVRDLRVSIAPLSSDGAVYGMLLLATDVTEQNQLRESMSRAEQMEALGRVAGGVAHDFNNLLTVISGYADLLRLRPQLPDTERELVDGIRTAADRASVLTQQLLAISRRQVSNPVVMAPNATLQALGEVLERIVGVDVTLTWHLDRAAGNIRIDPGRFEQTILNLAINARDAMAEGGRLHISTDAICGGGEGALPLGDYVRITVADTGSGMDEATRRRCFEPFYTTKDRAKGTGLGLAAVHSIVAESDGVIQVSSEPGQGTTFELYFPSVEDALVVEPPQPEPPETWGSEVILVVEDQDDVRKLIHRVLERSGYLVLDASSGPEALKVSEQWEGPIELLLTDVVMPGMRGPEVASAIKALRPSIQVLFTSAYSHGTIFPDGAIGDAPLLTKPFKPSELVAQVRAILDQRRRRLVRTDSPRPAPS